jgi:hypothetical protein
VEKEEDKLKGGRDDMEVQVVSRKKFLQQCPFCSEKPAANSIDALFYNFKIHLDKHLRNKDIVQDDFEQTLNRLKKSIAEQNGKE